MTILYVCCVALYGYMFVYFGELTKRFLTVCWVLQALRGLRARTRIDGRVGTLQYSVLLVLDTLILWTQVYVMKFLENKYDFDF